MFYIVLTFGVIHNTYPDNGYPDLQLISGFLAAIKLTDKSGYPDNGYPDLQTLVSNYEQIK